jgi:GNAT superfamily N-acetyltransferase
MTACRTELTLRPDELLSTHLQVAERDTTVVGLVQVKVTGTDADLLKLFVEPAQIRSGVGRLLFGWAAARAQGLGAVRMIIEADPGAAPFYETHGRTLCGLRSFKIDSWTNAAAHADGIGRACGVTVIGFEQPGCFWISAQLPACKSCIEWCLCHSGRGLTSKRLRFCAPGARSHDRGGAGSTTSGSVGVEPR